MSINCYKAVEKEIEALICRSDVPEDYNHAISVKKWVLRLKPNTDWALQIAALAHDIERAFPKRKIKRSEFSVYDEFKRAHALNSAKVIQEILDKYPIESKIKNKIFNLIKDHELGLDVVSDLSVLINADSLSFFEVNLPLYAQRNEESEILFRMKWGYKRLSSQARQILKKFRYRNERLNKFLDRVILSDDKFPPNKRDGSKKDS